MVARVLTTLVKSPMFSICVRHRCLQVIIVIWHLHADTCCQQPLVCIVLVSGAALQSTTGSTLCMLRSACVSTFTR